MKTIRAVFDGEKIVLPDEFTGLEPGEVLLVVAGAQDLDWVKAQEESLAKVWDNDEDSAYDAM